MDEMFREALARPQPVPGGGSAASYGSSVGVALLSKIAHLELGRESNSQETHDFWESLLLKLPHRVKELDKLGEQDGQVYLRMAAAGTSGGKSGPVFQTALMDAIQCPVAIMKKCYETLLWAVDAASRCGKHLLSDLMVVGELLRAGGMGCYHIASANIRLVRDDQTGNRLKRELERYREALQKAFERLAAGCRASSI